MIYKCIYNTPKNFDNILMSSDGEYLTGLRFSNSHTIVNYEAKSLAVFKETIRWLDMYFSGIEPDFTPLYKINDLTPFRSEVFEIINSISFGNTLSYDDISKIIAKKRGIKKMSSQAVGRAVGWNSICIIIPCHRVVGKNGDLVGYNGGLNNKKALLNNEGIDLI